MPYIDKDRRKPLYDFITGLAGKIETEGDLNFAISYLLHCCVGKWSLNYATLNKLIGVMECAKLEFYRQVVVPYEQTRLCENGSLSGFDHHAQPWLEPKIESQDQRGVTGGK